MFWPNINHTEHAPHQGVGGGWLIFYYIDLVNLGSMQEHCRLYLCFSGHKTKSRHKLQGWHHNLIIQVPIYSQQGLSQMQSCLKRVTCAKMCSLILAV